MCSKLKTTVYYSIIETTETDRTNLIFLKNLKRIKLRLTFIADLFIHSFGCYFQFVSHLYSQHNRHQQHDRVSIESAPTVVFNSFNEFIDDQVSNEIDCFGLPQFHEADDGVGQKAVGRGCHDRTELSDNARRNEKEHDRSADDNNNSFAETDEKIAAGNKIKQRRIIIMFR